MSNAGPPRVQQWPRVLPIVVVVLLLAGLAVLLWGVARRALVVAALEREMGANNEWHLWSQRRGLRATASDWLSLLIRR